jgi:hypothetical protein
MPHQPTLAGRPLGPESSADEWRAAYQELAATHEAAESQLFVLENLYSASVQLLGARSPVEVVKIVAEVLENLIGAVGFSMLVWRPGERMAKVVLKRGEVSGDSRGEDVEWAIHRSEPSVLTSKDGQLKAAVAPLHYDGKLVGAIIIERLLPQKQGRLGDTDVELLAMLSGQAGPALVRSHERARAEHQKSAVENLLATDAGAATFQGNLDDTKVVDILQLISIVRKSGRLSVAAKDVPPLELFFLEGAVIGANQADEPVPLKDAPEVLSHLVERSGTFSFFPEAYDPRDERRMRCDELVLEALRLYDERENKGGKPALPDDLGDLDLF